MKGGGEAVPEHTMWERQNLRKDKTSSHRGIPMEASTGDDKPVPERYDVEQAGGDSDDDEPDWLSAAGEDVGMSPASSRGDLRSKYTPGGGTGESVSQCTTRSSSTRSAYHSANDEKSESPEPARITINRLPPRRGKKPTSQAKPLDAELFSEKFESLEHEASCSSSAAAFSPMSATTTDSPSTAFRPISLGEGTPQVLLEAVPAEELPRSTSAADAEFADWANWEQANVGGSLDGGGMDAYASTPLPAAASRILSPLARREVERKAAEEMAKRTYASWDTIDDFNPRAGESDSPPPAGAEFGDEEMAGGTASKSRRTRSATASLSGGGGGRGRGVCGSLCALLRPRSAAGGSRRKGRVCPSGRGADGKDGRCCQLPRRRSLLWPVVCVCVLALTLTALTWAQPRSGRDFDLAQGAQPAWLVWAERVRTASGDLISAHLRWSEGRAGGSDEWQVVRRGGGVPRALSGAGLSASVRPHIPPIQAPAPARSASGSSSRESGGGGGGGGGSFSRAATRSDAARSPHGRPASAIDEENVDEVVVEGRAIPSRGFVEEARRSPPPPSRRRRPPPSYAAAAAAAAAAASIAVAAVIAAAAAPSPLLPTAFVATGRAARLRSSGWRRQRREASRAMARMIVTRRWSLCRADSNGHPLLRPRRPLRCPHHRLSPLPRRRPRPHPRPPAAAAFPLALTPLAAPATPPAAASNALALARAPSAASRRPPAGDRHALGPLPSQTHVLSAEVRHPILPRAQSYREGVGPGGGRGGRAAGGEGGGSTRRREEHKGADDGYISGRRGAGFGGPQASSQASRSRGAQDQDRCA